MALTLLVSSDLATTQAKVLAALADSVANVDGTRMYVTGAVEVDAETVNVLGHRWNEKSGMPDTGTDLVVPVTGNATVLVG